MKNKIVCVLCLIFAMFLSGCISSGSVGNIRRGRITLVNWDSRDAEQLKAAQYADGVVYGAQPDTDKSTERMGVGVWTEILDLITRLRVHLQVVDIQWAYQLSDASFKNTNTVVSCTNNVQKVLKK